MIVQAIVWDLGGVLVRTEDRQPRTHLAEELSLSYDGLDRLVFNSPSARQASRGEISAGQHWLNVSQQLSWPVEKIQELQDRFWGGDRLDHTLVNFMPRLEADLRDRPT